MAKTYKWAKLPKLASLVFLLMFATIGYQLLNNSHAATNADISGPSGTPDGKVDIYDLNVLLTNYNKTNATFAQGDISSPSGTPDGKVDIFDLSAMLTSWGSVASCVGTSVASGGSIQTAINNNPTGTTFCLTGTYNITTTLVPKDGDVFMGPATLDGGHTTQFAFSGNQNGINNVRLSGLLVQHFNPPVQLAALDHSPGTGWIIDHNEVAFNSTEGIEVYSNGTVNNNHVHDNGQEGIFGYQPTGAKIINNEVDHNNTAYYDQAVEAGGIKVSGSTNLTIQTNNVHDNYGVGIWLDTNDSAYLIDNNTVTNSSHHGIKIEASKTGTVSNNTVTNSGWLTPSPYGGDGINVDRSATTSPQTVTVKGNTVKCSQGVNYSYVNSSTVVDDGSNISNACAAVPLSIKVSGNHFIDGNGNAVRLIGVNRSGTQYACVEGWGFFDGPTDTTSLGYIKSWGANAIRVSLNEDCWLGINGSPATYSGSNYVTAITSYVNRINALGMYVILDLHWNAPGTTLSGGSGDSQQPMADRDHAPAFWQSVANNFKANPAVVFDVYNEPHPDSNHDTTAAWTCVRDGGTCPGVSFTAAGSQELVNAIRGTGANNPILIGGPEYAGDVDQWTAYKPNDSANQLAASIHIYYVDPSNPANIQWSPCDFQSCWNSTIAPLAATTPIVMGEIGEHDCTFNYLSGSAIGQPNLLDWADQHGISYLAWSWIAKNGTNCAAEPSLVLDYLGNPTNYGIGIKNHLQALP